MNQSAQINMLQSNFPALTKTFFYFEPYNFLVCRFVLRKKLVSFMDQCLRNVSALYYLRPIW